MTQIDEAKLEQFLHQAVGDMAAAISGLLVHLGDRLGLYRAMADAGPVTPEALAGQTGTATRYVREWLSNQAAGGYVSYQPADGNSPAFLGGVYEGIASCYSDYQWLVDAFRTGAGVGWEQHDERLFSGVGRLFRPSYAAYLTSTWIPALDGAGVRVGQGPFDPATGRVTGASIQEQTRQCLANVQAILTAADSGLDKGDQRHRDPR